MKHALLPFGLLILCALMACAKQIPANQYQTDFPHNKEAWATWRASVTNTGQEAFHKADQGWDANTKPPNYGADYQRKEGHALWQMHCAVCHGPQGRTNPQKITPAPRKLGGMGLKMGFFFGGDKMRAGIFKKIKTGQSTKPKTPSQMAGFGDLLHNEQIWALVLHLENL